MRSEQDISMKLSTRLATTLFAASSLAAIRPALGDAPPQLQLKSDPLRGSLNSADISSDEQFVVTESTKRSDTTDPGTKTFAEVVQIWNFKADKLLAEFTAQTCRRKRAFKRLLSRSHSQQCTNC
jgi:hypothetical protein